MVFKFKIALVSFLVLSLAVQQQVCSEKIPNQHKCEADDNFKVEKAREYR